jgi:hypothetical protein
MCAVAALPLALGVGSFAVSAGSSVLGYLGQQQAANDQANYQSQLSALEQQRLEQEKRQLVFKAGMDNERIQQQALAMRVQQAQEQDAASREMFSVMKEARAAKARTKVAAGEAGIKGISVDALLDEIGRSELGYYEAVLRQQTYKSQYYDESQKTMARDVQNNRLGLSMNLDTASLGSQFNLTRINQPIYQPSFAGLGLNILRGGLDAGNTYFSSKYYTSYGAGSGRTSDVLSFPF